MTCRLTQAAHCRFPMEEQNPLPSNDDHDKDFQWPEEGEEDPMDEPLSEEPVRVSVSEEVQEQEPEPVP